MSTITIDAHRRHLTTLQRDITEYAESGHYVVLHLGENTPPQRILKVLEATAGAYNVKLVVRHAELREYVENAITGTAVGIFLAGVAGILSALATGNPIQLGNLLGAMGLGGLLGGLIGLSSTPISKCILYKSKNATLIKFIPK